MPEKFQNKYRIQSARLQGYDYRNEGAYFITICTQHRNHYFGECRNGIMCLSALGMLAQQFWFEIPNHFPNTTLGEFVVMPDHIHGILIITEKCEIPPAVETHNYASPSNDPPVVKTHNYASLRSAPAKSVSTIIRAYKSAVTIESRKLDMEFAWQTRFHDHIIRDHFEYERITNYIIRNPSNWGRDA